MNTFTLKALTKSYEEAIRQIETEYTEALRVLLTGEIVNETPKSVCTPSKNESDELKNLQKQIENLQEKISVLEGAGFKKNTPIISIEPISIRPSTVLPFEEYSPLVAINDCMESDLEDDGSECDSCPDLEQSHTTSYILENALGKGEYGKENETSNIMQASAPSAKESNALKNTDDSFFSLPQARQRRIHHYRFSKRKQTQK